MFTLAIFGAEMTPAQPLYGALLATAGVFRGFLLLLGLRKAWEISQLSRALRGCGAYQCLRSRSLATLYQPVFNSVNGSARWRSLLPLP